jgi:iron complex transport system substrate-binding protein
MVAAKLNGLGSEVFSWISDVKSPTSDGGNRSVGTCMHVAAYLNPWIRDLPVISSWSMPPNYEMLVSLGPDVVIIRAGDCTFYMDEESRQKAIDTIESLDIPLVVTYAPNTYDEPNMSIISEEIRIIGSIGKEVNRRDCRLSGK